MDLQPRWAGYALAIAATTLAVTLRSLFSGVLTGTPYLAFYPAVVAAAAFGGMGPGLLATIGSALSVDILFDSTPGWLNVSDPVAVGRIAIFLAGGIGISLVAGLKRAAQVRERSRVRELASFAESLRRSEELRGLALEAAKVGTWDFDPATNRIIFDDRSREIFGLADSQINFREFLGTVVHPEDAAHVAGEVKQALDPASDGLYQIDYRVIRSDRSAHWVAARGQVYFTGEGDTRHPSRFVGTVLDIDARKKAEQQLQELNETLERRVAVRTEQAEQRAGQLRRLAAELTEVEQRERQRLAQVLHDNLQQLLIAAKFSVASARRSNESSAFMSALDRVDGLIDQSLEASRSLTAELSPSVLYMGSFANALRWLGAWMRDKHGLTVRVEAAPDVDLHPENVRVLVFQAIRELLLNVVKHAGVNSATVTLDAAADNQVLVVVEDKGTGFDVESRSRQTSDSGLGLFSVRERLELLGGHLKIESAPDRGTRVSLWVPSAARPGKAGGLVSTAGGRT